MVGESTPHPHPEYARRAVSRDAWRQAKWTPRLRRSRLAGAASRAPADDRTPSNRLPAGSQPAASRVPPAGGELRQPFSRHGPARPVSLCRVEGLCAGDRAVRALCPARRTPRHRPRRGDPADGSRLRQPGVARCRRPVGRAVPRGAQGGRPVLGGGLQVVSRPRRAGRQAHAFHRGPAAGWTSPCSTG